MTDSSHKHHKPVGCVMPIHNAQPAVSDSETPAKRMPQAPEAPPRTLKSSQGATVKATDVPAANASMMTAPSHAVADKDATNKAEYNKPQGINAHPTPSTNGALDPNIKKTGLALRQTRCANVSTQAGWRPHTSKAKPSTKAATCSMVHTGRRTTVLAPNHANP